LVDQVNQFGADDRPTGFGCLLKIKTKALRKMRHPTRIRKLEGFIELPGA
jgi:hypothetical protein